MLPVTLSAVTQPSLRLAAAGVFLLGASIAYTPAQANPQRIESRPTVDQIAPARIAQFAGRVRDAGAPDDSERVEFSVTLRHQHADQLMPFSKAVSDPNSPLFRHFLTASQFDAYFTPTSLEENNVIHALQLEGFSVINRLPNRAMITVQGSVSTINKVFAVRMRHMFAKTETVRKTATLMTPIMPAELSGQVDDIIGLDDVISSQPMSQIAKVPASQSFKRDVSSPSVIGGAQTGPYGGLGPATIASNLDFPAQQGFTGGGQLIGIVSGDQFGNTDVQAYESHFNVPATGTISLKPVGGGGGYTTCSGGADNWTTESDIDVEMVVGLAPAANINFYSMPTAGSGCNHTLSNYSTNEVAAVNYSVSDGVRVLSLSLGGCENDSTSYDNAMASAFASASSQGETILVASGDNGWGGCDSKPYMYQAQAPAADNNATAIGGLQPGASGNYQPPAYGWTPTTCNQTVNNVLIACSAGYNSNHYGQDSSQSGVVPGGNRDIPDISMPADSIVVYVAGSYYPNAQGTELVGTSIGTPMFAAAQAEMNQESGSTQGCITNQLYNIYKTYGYNNYSPAMYYDMTVGNNGQPTKTGWDYVTGLGQPDLQGIERVKG